MKTIYIWTDGACQGNPGKGGWGAMLKWQDTQKTLQGFSQYTTNNRMELLAPIMALEQLKTTCHVIITTDSQYVKQGITSWVQGWKKNGWKTAQKKPVKNQDLWQRLDAICQQHQIEWQWVRGHTGDPYNEMADSLARGDLKADQDFGLMTDGDGV